MTELTIFSAPKPFTDPHIALIQRNAIRSWTSLGPEVEVILVGDEPGLPEAASELGVRLLKDVRRNDQGTPLVSDIFELARQASHSPRLVYVNADVILMPDLTAAAQQTANLADQFLIVGQRWDLDVRQPIDFSPGWDARLRAEVERRGRLHPPGGSDYFVFPAGCFTEIPDFAIGRAGWDNWMIYQARRQGWTVVDATPSIMPIHQDHDYSHLPGGQTHYSLEESERNRALAGGKSHMYVLYDANRRLAAGKLRPLPVTLPRLIRKLEIWLMPEGTSLKGLRWEMVWSLRRLRVRVEKAGEEVDVRYGQNPAKFVEEVHQPARVTVAVVSYIPFLSGYYAQSLDVLKACLASIWEHTSQPYDLMVFDNASCEEARQFLLDAHRQGRIQYLVLSEKNVGKAGAWNYIFGAAPGEIIAYADSDIYFYPGWLAPQIEALETFSNVGMVTGMPLRTPHQYSTATLAWAEHEPGVHLERGSLLPWEDYWRHSASLGLSPEQARQNYGTSEDACIEYQGKRYYVGAGHFQFVARKAALQAVLPIPSRRPMGQVRLLDVAINEQGGLRLSTQQWCVRHMGNTLEGVPELAAAEKPPGKPGIKAKGASGIFQWKPVRRVLLAIYDRIFGIYFRQQS